MNLEQESTSISDRTPDNSTTWFGALNARLHSFFEGYGDQSDLNEQTRFGQRALNSFIFFVLLIAVLIFLGVGLSWLNGASQIDDSQVKLPASNTKSAEAPPAIPPA